jgi:uncharacterized protein (DUF2336 family)
MAETRSNRTGARSDAARLLLAAARERFVIAATDLLLPEISRLSEWQRLTAANLLSRLVRAIEDDLRIRLAPAFEQHAALHAALSSAHVPIALPILERAQALRDPDFGTALVRRVEEHRFWKAGGGAGGSDFLFELVRDPDENIAAAAMDIVIARSRRFDRFQEPDLARGELPAELQHRLVWLVAAALRHYIAQQHGLDAIDGPIQGAATEIIAGYDESEGLESGAMRLAALLRAAGRLDGSLLARVLEEGSLPLFVAGIATLCALEHAAAWEILSDPRGRGPAILLRAAGLERDDAARIVLALNSRGRFVSEPEGDVAATQLDIFESTTEAAAREVLRLWQADPAYRASVARLSTRARSAEAA